MTVEEIKDRFSEEICGTVALIENIILDKSLTKAQIIEKLKFIDHILCERQKAVNEGRF